MRIDLTTVACRVATWHMQTHISYQRHVRSVSLNHLPKYTWVFARSGQEAGLHSVVMYNEITALLMLPSSLYRITYSVNVPYPRTKWLKSDKNVNENIIPLDSKIGAVVVQFNDKDLHDLVLECANTTASSNMHVTFYVSKYVT